MKTKDLSRIHNVVILTFNLCFTMYNKSIFNTLKPFGIKNLSQPVCVCCRNNNAKKKKKKILVESDVGVYVLIFINNLLFILYNLLLFLLSSYLIIICNVCLGIF